MNQEELYQRQQQIHRLHKRIREYRLTNDEERQLRKNKEEQEALIESKFAASKINENYRFPKMIIDDESPCLGCKDVCDLSDMSTLDTIKRQISNPIT